MWPQVTGSDPKVMSFDRKSPGSCLEDWKLSYNVRFTSYQLCLEGGSSHFTGNVTWPQVTGSDPKVMSIERKLPGSGGRRPKTRVLCAFHFLQSFIPQEETFMSQEMTLRNLRWPEVALKWRHLTGSHLEVVVESQNSRGVCVSLPTRQSLDKNHVTWPQVSGSDPEVTSFDRKSPGSG